MRKKSIREESAISQWANWREKKGGMRKFLVTQTPKKPSRVRNM